MSNYKLLYITCGSKIEAVNLGKLLVKNRLAACTNIVPNIKLRINFILPPVNISIYCFKLYKNL